MAKNQEWWQIKRWYFNGREIQVVNPDELHLSVVCIPSHLDIADYIVELHNTAFKNKEKNNGDSHT